jgi:hypothetical protein
MAGYQELKQATSALQTIDDDIAKILTNLDDDWRRQLISARRRMIEVITRLSTVISGQASAAEFSSQEQSLLRESLNSFRTATAYHQAKFPASTISDAAAYRQSSLEVHAARKALTTLVDRIVSERLESDH